MNKKKGFFSKLKKSTIITMTACGSFVVATFFALLFFIKFPISPPEKMTASLGRRSTYGLNTSYSTTQAVTETTTTESAETTATTTTELTTRTDYVITVTMGKGFNIGGEDLYTAYTPETDYTMADAYYRQTTTASQDDDDSDGYGYADDDYYYNDNYYYDDYYPY